MPWMRRGFFGLAVAGCLLILPQCASNTTGGPVCAIGGMVYANVSSPAPGATGVPTAAGDLVLIQSLPVPVHVALQPSLGGSPLPLGVLATAAPGASPGPPALISFPYPQLQSATTYQVTYKAISSAQCPPELFSNGSFTTE